MAKILFISSSLRRESLGRQVSQQMLDWALINFPQFEFSLLDLAFVDVPRCQGVCVDEAVASSSLDKCLREAAGLIVTFPVYGQSFPGVLKDLLDNTHLPGKPIFLIETLETTRSFLAFENLTNYLIFGHNSLVFPKFLAFSKEDMISKQMSEKMLARSSTTLTNFIKLVELLKDNPIFNGSTSHANY